MDPVTAMYQDSFARELGKIIFVPEAVEMPALLGIAVIFIFWTVWYGVPVIEFLVKLLFKVQDFIHSLFH